MPSVHWRSFHSDAPRCFRHHPGLQLEEWEADCCCCCCNNNCCCCCCSPRVCMQLEEWEADPSPGQLSLVEALREVLTALIKDLSRRYVVCTVQYGTRTADRYGTRTADPSSNPHCHWTRLTCASLRICSICRRLSLMINDSITPVLTPLHILSHFAS